MARWTLRRQLTLLYAGPFLVSGAALLLIPLLGVSETAPVPGQGGGPGPVVPHPSGGGGALRNQLLGLSAVSFALMVIVAIAAGWFIAGRYLRPLRLIIDTARDISATNLHRRLGPAGRRGEFAELAGTLDDLFGRLEASFAAQRRFVANASHELRTPLTAQRTLLQVALADPDASAGSLRAAGREVLALGEAQARLIDALLTLATGEQGIERPEPFDLAAVARTVLDARAGAAEAAGLTVTAALSPAPALGDERLAEILVANLVDNAIRHNTGPGGRVEVATEGAALTVANTGPAVPPEDLERLFQPFQRLGAQRVRSAADGHGLGLAIVRAVAAAHGGEVTARPRPGGGLVVRVSLPTRGPR
ncbi:sensor histidine kinase [Dactylosporangium sp. CA-139066]|uniref:sensor histidine kinase n=1 Tax=Dactylosporangium sp. CA-139066 TaxID=3239930 RepID=UPI003D8D4726